MTDAERARELAEDFVCQQNIAVKLILPLAALQRERDEAVKRLCKMCLSLYPGGCQAEDMEKICGSRLAVKGETRK
jgi:hypothetical protein